ncbi:MAG: HypC/HybG/HupF family hydrogenase formation chaperone [Candidatus Limnocylindrales bacterium]
MCLSYPGQVLSIDDGEALVQTEGRRRRASTLACPEVVVGDWVIVGAGSVLTRLAPADAAEVRRLIQIAAGHQGDRTDARAT